MIKGSIVAIVTPMLEDGSIDYKCFRSLLEWHVEQGTQAVVVAGTTGESPTLNIEEHIQIIDYAVKCINGRIPVIAGSGANSTQEAIDLTLEVKNIGANMTLQVVPYYNKPTQEGLVAHFSTIAQSCDLPVMLYNVPSRTITDMLPETVCELAQINNIVAIKEASGDIDRIEPIIKSGLDVYSGDDVTAFKALKKGAIGVVSVTANIKPNLMQNMCQYVLEGNIEKAEEINEQLMSLHDMLFIESNPIPVKWAMYYMGKIESGIRLPLTQLSKSNRNFLEDLLV